MKIAKLSFTATSTWLTKQLHVDHEFLNLLKAYHDLTSHRNLSNIGTTWSTKIESSGQDKNADSVLKVYFSCPSFSLTESDHKQERDTFNEGNI